MHIAVKRKSIGNGDIEDSKKEKMMRTKIEYLVLAHLITHSKDLLKKFDIYQKKLLKYIDMNLIVSGIFFIDDFSLL